MERQHDSRNALRSEVMGRCVGGDRQERPLEVACSLRRRKMKALRPACPLALALALVASCSPSPPPPPVADFAGLMEEIVATYGFAGAVVVARGDEVVYEGAWGFANREAGMVFTPDTPADGGSLAKTFAAAGIWQLQAEGLLSVDDAVSHHVPEFPHAETTIRQLLEHSAGLTELEDPTGLTNLGVIGALDADPSFDPGSRFRYCNECFDVLALITERVTGQAWPGFLAERFFTPFGLDSAFVRPAMFEDWSGTRTRSYRATGGRIVEHDVFDNEPFYGSSNIYLSARDVARWARASMRGAGLDSAIWQEALRRPVFRDEGPSALNYLNWFQQTSEGPAYFDGHIRGFHCVAFWDPGSELVVAWVSNTLHARPLELQLTRDLVAVAEGTATGPSPGFDFEVPSGSTGPEPFRGTYEVPGLGLVEFDWEGGVGSVRIDDGPAHDAYPSHGLYLPDFGAEIGFSRREREQFQTFHWQTLFENVSGSRVVEH